MEGLKMDAAMPPVENRNVADDTVDVGTAHRDSNIEEVLAELERELVGLRPVKAHIRQIASLLLVARLREQMELSTDRPTLHMSSPAGPARARPRSPCEWRRCCITWVTCAVDIL